jgi:hypothetical protein
MALSFTNKTNKKMSGNTKHGALVAATVAAQLAVQSHQSLTLGIRSQADSSKILHKQKIRKSEDVNVQAKNQRQQALRTSLVTARAFAQLLQAQHENAAVILVRSLIPSVPFTNPLSSTSTPLFQFLRDRRLEVPCMSSPRTVPEASIAQLLQQSGEEDEGQQQREKDERRQQREEDEGRQQREKDEGRQQREKKQSSRKKQPQVSVREQLVEQVVAERAGTVDAKAAAETQAMQKREDLMQERAMRRRRTNAKKSLQQKRVSYTIHFRIHTILYC